MKISVRALLSIFFALPCGNVTASCWTAEPSSQNSVYVLLWFDTEDYILPQSDDAARRIAEILSKQGVRATFKVVGEKARALERRGRRDVIEALARHEVGYHSDNHSRHPTVAEYESRLGWAEGAAEFTRRERAGFDDVRRIFGLTPTCYGQPGSSWAPQAFAALNDWGVKVYLDDARQVGLEGKPFWFGGLLNIFNVKYGSQLHPNSDWSNLAEAKAGFQQACAELQLSGGVVSVYFHPCQFIHREFWDGVNFARGANPPREQWRLPPVKTAAEIERDFNYLDSLVGFMKSLPHVQFITASEALSVMADKAKGRDFSSRDISELAGRVTSEVSFQEVGEYALAASEQFALLSDFVARAVRRNPSERTQLRVTPYGPASMGPPLPGDAEIPWDQFSRTVLDVDDFLARNNQIPAAVWMGSVPMPPESYLVALARVARRLEANQAPPKTVTLSPAHLAASRYVANDSQSLWDWIIFPPGFHAPEMMTLAKLQAWTLKPAIINSPEKAR